MADTNSTRLLGLDPLCECVSSPNEIAKRSSCVLQFMSSVIPKLPCEIDGELRSAISLILDMAADALDVIAGGHVGREMPCPNVNRS